MNCKQSNGLYNSAITGTVYRELLNTAINCVSSCKHAMLVECSSVQVHYRMWTSGIVHDWEMVWRATKTHYKVNWVTFCY